MLILQVSVTVQAPWLGLSCYFCFSLASLEIGARGRGFCSCVTSLLGSTDLGDGMGGNKGMSQERRNVIQRKIVKSATTWYQGNIDGSVLLDLLLWEMV